VLSSTRSLINAFIDVKATEYSLRKRQDERLGEERGVEERLTPKPPAAKLVDSLRAHTGKSIVVAEFGCTKRSKECV
jgi:hypothetical protein